ncbi:MAG TPA: hypothetical protein PK530_15700 [Anaerolineales bacterium]|nr:hypothetical protein [Anaerolineales bacterium]
MKFSYPIQLQQAVDALRTRPGTCSPELRQSIEAYAAQKSVGAREARPIPAELVKYVDKVTLNAYKITDEDVQQLRTAGYSEDAIFEITLCASVGASLARMDRGLKALEASHALTNS